MVHCTLQSPSLPLCYAAIFFGLWGFLTLRFWHVISHRHALGQLMGASFYLFPWLWCKMLGVESYTRWRLWVISGELGCMLQSGAKNSLIPDSLGHLN